MALPAAQAEPPALRERTRHVTEGEVVVDATPMRVYEVATDYLRWQAWFSDVGGVKHEAGDREHARVRFHSRTFGRPVTVQFDNVPGHAIRFRSVKNTNRTRAEGEYLLLPHDGGRRTRVVARLYTDVFGAARMLVSDGKLRKMRRAKLAADLRDAQRWFEVRR